MVKNSGGMFMSEEFVQRLQQALDAKGISWSKAATSIGLSAQASSKWKKGQISKESLELLANLLGVSVDWLLTGSNNVQVQTVDDWDSETPLESDEVEVVFFKDFKLACGSGSFNEALNTERRRLRLSRATLERRGIYKDQVFATTAKDDSMYPEIKDGDTVYIDQQRNYIKDGRIFAIEHGSLFRCKRLYALPNGGVRIVSDNKEEYDEEILTATQIQEQGFRILGWVFKVDRLNEW